MKTDPREAPEPRTLDERLSALEERGTGIALSSGWVLVLVVPLLLVVLWFAVSYAKAASDHSAAKLARTLALKSYEGSIRACQRGNALRAQINTQVIAAQTDFLESAATSRRLSAESAPTAAQRQQNLAIAAHFHALSEGSKPLPLINCSKAYSRP